MNTSTVPGRRRLALGLATVLAAAGIAALPGPAQATAGTARPAPPVGEIHNAGGVTAIPGNYLVVLHDRALRAAGGPAAVAATADSLTARYGGTLGRVFRSAVRGFEVRLSEAGARRLAADPAVAYVEQDHVVSLAGAQPNPPSWGLDRIDQRFLPLDNQYRYPNTARNVHAYVIDTGIRLTHTEFGGRATSGIDTVDGGTADDCNGHGTHLAGIVGGRTYGVAKEVRLVAVRVLSCTGSGSIAGVVAGVDWVTANAIRPAVASLSLGGTASAVMDTAVTNSIASGVTYSVASGSSATDACNFSPSRVPTALTVAGTTSTDAKMGSANFGTCLDIFAPGQGITSAWYTNDTATNTISGSSMGTAHVTGDAALVVSPNPTWTAAQVSRFITANATAGVVTSPGTGSPNRLLFVVN
ncbi:hypothetical protein GCM10022225_21130 [Plantactinospora mayteni]|uniref:Serine protease n=1 Tax=Plantactinospora mayteni TaxID=566021 RepID=A0ABQ4ENR4_9ACTN|nr:S8 family peptidase [Plantactinospora mayteni]GIG96294.1 hypothetical protein Pma05_28670 [Plantactinospora mayteni]